MSLKTLAFRPGTRAMLHQMSATSRPLSAVAFDRAVEGTAQGTTRGTVDRAGGPDRGPDRRQDGRAGDEGHRGPDREVHRRPDRPDNRRADRRVDDGPHDRLNRGVDRGRDRGEDGRENGGVDRPGDGGGDRPGATEKHHLRANLPGTAAKAGVTADSCRGRVRPWRQRCRAPLAGEGRQACGNPLPGRLPRSLRSLAVTGEELRVESDE